MEKSDASASNGHPFRKIHTMAISHILMEVGFQSVEPACLETLTEMYESLLFEAGHSAIGYCELAGRTSPIFSDIVMALINMGISMRGIEAFAKRDKRQIIPMPPSQSQQKQINLLQAGTKSSHPPHIPSYLPALPDPHAYVRTPTHKQPVTEYEAIREKAASQKRDVDKALSKFFAKTTQTESLFVEKDTMFPLISSALSNPTYLEALNPTDQVFDFEELEYHYLVANRTEDVTSKDDNDENESGNEDDGDREKELKQDTDIKPNSTINKAILENPNVDSPYLRAATLPKRSKPATAVKTTQ